MLNIAICDDDKAIRQNFRNMIQKSVRGQEVMIESYEDCETLLKEMKRGSFFDIIFLDIALQNMDGIEAGVKLRRELKCMDTMIIYITAYPDYVLRSFDAQPFDFIRKPVCQVRLDETMRRAIRKIEESNFIFEQKRTQDEDIRCPVREILWFEISPLHKVTMVARSRKESFRGRLDEVETRLEKMGVQKFLRVQKSYLVNMDYIVRCNQHVVMVENYDYGITVGKKYKKDMMVKISEYFGI